MASTIASNKYVIINEDGLVISYFNGSDLPEYNENMIHVIDVTNVSPQPNLNWTYSGGNFTEPVTTRDTSIPPVTQLKMDYISNIIADVDYMGHTFNFGVDTYHYLSSYAAFAGLSGVLPDGFYWLDKSNVEVYMTLEEFKDFCHIVSLRVFNSFDDYVTRRKAL